MFRSAMRALSLFGLLTYILASSSVASVEKTCSADDGDCIETKANSLLQSYTERAPPPKPERPPRPEQPPRPHEVGGSESASTQTRTHSADGKKTRTRTRTRTRTLGEIGKGEGHVTITSTVEAALLVSGMKCMNEYELGQTDLLQECADMVHDSQQCSNEFERNIESGHCACLERGETCTEVGDLMFNRYILSAIPVPAAIPATAARNYESEAAPTTAATTATAATGFSAEGTMLPLTDVNWDEERQAYDFADDVYADLDSNYFQWGTGDFTLKMTITPKYDNKVGVDRTYAALFIKSDEEGYPYTGPSCFIYDDGHIKFRLASTSDLGQGNKVQLADGWKANVPVDLTFIRQGENLFIYQGATQLGATYKVTDNFDVDNSAPLRIGGNHETATGQNMDVYLSGLESYNSAVFPEGTDITTEAAPATAATGFFAEGTMLPLTDVSWDEERQAYDFADDVYEDLDSNYFQWGTGDFTLKATITPKYDNKVAFDRTYASLFIKSDEEGYPYTGPSCFIFDSGHILFRLASTSDLGSGNKVQLPDGWKANVPVDLTFIRQGENLFIYQGAKQLGETYKVTDNFDVDNSATLRIGGNQATATDQNMDVYLSGLESYNSAVFPEGTDIATEARWQLTSSGVECCVGDDCGQSEKGSPHDTTFASCQAQCEEMPSCIGIEYGNLRSDSMNRCSDGNDDNCKCYLVTGGCDDPQEHLGYNYHAKVAR